MIKDKHPVEPPRQQTPVTNYQPEEVAENPFVNMYHAVRRAILTVREDPDNPLSPPLFKTVAIDNGQFARIVRGENTEYETAFPAVFIHFIVFQRLNVAIQDAKDREPALSERCNLTYFDMPLTTNMLQAYWIDYEVWFRESSAWRYRNWVERYLVMPPFTQHSDAPQHDSQGHGHHAEPAYDEATGFEPSVEMDTPADTDGDEGDDENP